MLKTVKRKTALFFSDIVGYSKMVYRSESHTLDLLKEHDIILEKEIKINKGKIIKHIGDAIFAEFESMDNAVKASISIQEKLEHRNQVFRGKDQINVRIGLHQGEVVEKDHDLFGNDVNLCSRIENVAIPGSIAISNIGLQSLDNQYYTHDYGKVKLKNIPSPCNIHRIYINKVQYENTRHEDFINQLIDLGVNLVSEDEHFDEDIQTVAILYPHNLGDAKDEFFCYSFLEQIISDLQKIDKIRTPGIFEVLKYKDSKKSTSQIAIELGVSNIAQLSIINEAAEFKVNIALKSMDTGQELLTDTLMGKHNEQRKISGILISKLANVFMFPLSKDVKQLFEEKHTIDNVAYKKYLEGKYLSDHMNKGDDLNKSQILLEEAIQIDGEFCEAYASLAMTQNLLGNYEHAEELLDASLEIAQRISNESALLTIYNYMGIYYKERKSYKKSIQYFEKGIKLQQMYHNDLMEARLMHNMSGSYSRIGEYDRALDFLYRSEKIFRKLEQNISLGNSNAEIGVVYKNIKEYSESLKYFDKAICIFKKEKMSFKIAQALIIQSDIYNQIKEFDKSINVLDQAVIIAEDFHDELMDGRIMNSYAQVYNHQKKYQKSKESLQQAIEHFQNMNRNNLVLDSMLELIQLHIKLNEYNLATEIYSRCKKLSARVNDPKILSSLEQLSEKLSSN